MARKKTEAETTETAETTEAAAETGTVKAEKKYTIEKLGQYCRKLYGCSTVTFAGATAGLDKDATYTVDEMAAIIKEWGGKKIARKKKEAE